LERKICISKPPQSILPKKYINDSSIHINGEEKQATEVRFLVAFEEERVVLKTL